MNAPQPEPHPSFHGCPVLDPTASAPHAEAAALRERGPAALVELPGGVRAWSVTRHAVIQALTTDPRVSRDYRRHWPGAAQVPEGWVLGSVAFQDSFFNQYGAEHRAARGRIAPTFLPRRAERMRPQVQETADRLVDELGALAPGERADLREALARPLTMTVICDLFGVPEKMRETLGELVDTVLDSSLDETAALAAQTELYGRLGELVEYKRARPASDLTSDLLLSDRPGEQPLTEHQLLGTLLTMIAAGFETAVNLITSAALELLTHPEESARLRAGAIGWADVIEETLRLDGPVMHLPLRYAVEDIDLGEGVLIRAGDPIIIGFAAAGRDPERHPDRPDAFDPSRPDKGHLAFGHGPHFCLGAPLARLEAEIALRTLFERLPDLALAEPGREPARLPSMIVSGPAALEVVPRPAA
ncbi:cytochrome P450 [Kitasatospora sp. NA04385]|uniref:cytochrome P450 family protein n=1 Tax=Kitasatospora sp. NA04385 TaxID=2742135 RepID=UPI0015903DC7|nr:cytochrome P450 [Kitasatospora sp. NA04385]QKW19033.1 cytochrome P450 [Kitasatospora sp. NA04385]